MNYYLLTSLIIAAFSGIISCTRQFQMLQQNSYFPSRYFNWVKDSYSVLLALSSIAFCTSSLLFGQKKYIIQLIFVFAVLIFRIIYIIRVHKTSIKKLVPTSRIKRMYLTMSVLFIIIILISLLFKNMLISEIMIVITFMVSFISPIMVFLVWTINYPIEKAISNWYINDAKKILKDHKNLIVIGITGSYGKTSTKFILERILSEKYNVVATPQSFNTPMGVVRTIREKIKPQTQIFICEMGAKNRGDIKEICEIVHPTYGIITSVGAQHLETFKTIDNVFNTKFELYEEVHKNNGIVFVNGDSKELIRRIDNRECEIYGTSNNFKICTDHISYDKNGSRFIFNYKGSTTDLSTRLLGIHSIINIVGAAALSSKLGITQKELICSVSSLKPTEHRLELKRYIKGSIMIDDAYNANPEGCIEAVHVLSYFENMKKIIITPGLVELGSKEYDSNFALGSVAAQICDIIILVGKNRSKPIRDGVESKKFNNDNVFIAGSFKEAVQIYSGFADNNTVVLLENDLPDNYLF